MSSIKKVFTQTAWQVASKIVTAICGFIILGLITRFYGEEGTGVFTLALTYLAIFFLAADLGLNAYILPRVPFKQEANLLFNFRLVWSVILVVIANLLALYLPVQNPLFKQAVFFGSLSIILSAIYNSTNLIFQKNLRYDQSSLAASIGALSQIPVFFYLINHGVSVGLLTTATLFGWIVSSAVAFILAKKIFKFEFFIVRINYPLSILSSAWPITLTLLLNIVYFRVDSFILSFYRSLAEVGNYNIAYAIFQNALVIPTFIMNSFYPIMIENLKNSFKNFLNQVKLASLILLLISLLGTLLTWFIAPLLIKIISPEGFSGSTLSLRILSLSFPAYFISSLLMWIYISLKKYHALVAIYSFGLLINILLNLVFIPTHSYIASSWITGISEYLILFLQIFILFGFLKSKNEPNY